jgi:hypothetical protein
LAHLQKIISLYVFLVPLDYIVCRLDKLDMDYELERIKYVLTVYNDMYLRYHIWQNHKKYLLRFKFIDEFAFLSCGHCIDTGINLSEHRVLEKLAHI